MLGILSAGKAEGTSRYALKKHEVQVRAAVGRRATGDAVQQRHESGPTQAAAGVNDEVFDVFGVVLRLGSVELVFEAEWHQNFIDQRVTEPRDLHELTGMLRLIIVVPKNAPLRAAGCGPDTDDAIGVSGSC